MGSRDRVLFAPDRALGMEALGRGGRGVQGQETADGQARESILTAEIALSALDRDGPYSDHLVDDSHCTTASYL
jgi:hypothetical protein